jgi:DNA polymerase-1
MKHALIDGDMILYRAAFAAEVETKWEDDIFTLHTDFNQAKAEASQLIETILEKIEATECSTFFSDRKTFRHDLFPEYKANRKDKRSPLGINELREWMMETFNGKLWENLEADDVIGILATADRENTIAVSGDKDFGTLPCAWYNFLKDEFKDTTIEEADRFHLIQAMAGDSTDGYAGVPGVGLITAQKLLDKKGESWETVVDVYDSKGLTEDDALLTARLARILRHTEYDRETQEIKLWTPQKNS